MLHLTMYNGYRIAVVPRTIKRITEQPPGNQDIAAVLHLEDGSVISVRDAYDTVLIKYVRAHAARPAAPGIG